MPLPETRALRAHLPAAALLTSVGLFFFAQDPIAAAPRWFGGLLLAGLVGWGLAAQRRLGPGAWLALGVLGSALFGGMWQGHGEPLALALPAALGLAAGALWGRQALPFFGIGLVGVALAQLPWQVMQGLSDVPFVFVRGWFLDSNSLAAFAVLAAAGLASLPRRRWHWAAFLGLAVLWAGPKSKGAILAVLAIAYLTLLATALAGARARWKKAAVLVVPLGAAALAAWLGSAQLSAIWQTASVQARIGLWTATLKMAGDGDLFTGRGPGMWPLLYPYYRGPLDSDSAGSFAHNDYLQLLAEQGVPALALALGILALAAWRAWHSLRSAGGAPGRWANLGVLAFMLHSITNFLITSPMLAIPLGVLLAVADHAGEPLPRKRGPSVLGLSLVAGLGLFMSWHGLAAFAKTAAFAPGAWYGTVLPYWEAGELLQALAGSRPALLYSAHAQQGTALKQLLAAKVERDPTARARQAQAALQTAQEGARLEPWRLSARLSAITLEADAYRLGLLPIPPQALAKLLGEATALEKAAPFAVAPIKIKAGLLKMNGGCEAARAYLGERKKELTLEAWRRELAQLPGC